MLMTMNVEEMTENSQRSVNNEKTKLKDLGIGE